MNGNVSGSQSFTLAPGAPGTYTINLSGDVSDYDTDETSYPSGTVTVVFTTRPVDPTPMTPTTPTTPRNNNNNSNNNNNNGNNTQPEKEKSTNNNIKEIVVEGLDLIKVDDINYKLKVANSVTQINIKATAEDSLATVSGAGSKVLLVGDNKFEVVVTAENGAKKSYYITITRKDVVNYLVDLKDVLKEEDNLDIVLNKDDVISSEDLELIKKSKKIVNFMFLDDNKEVKYLYIIDGSKIEDTNELKTNIMISSDRKDYKDMFNYSEGLYFKTDNEGVFPENTLLKLYVGDRYKDDSGVEIYYYDTNSKKSSIYKKVVIVQDGYIIFNISKGSNFYIKEKAISNVKALEAPEEIIKKNSMNIFLIVAVIEFVIILCLVFLLVRKNKKAIAELPKITVGTIDTSDTVHTDDIIVADSLNNKQ